MQIHQMEVAPKGMGMVISLGYDSRVEIIQTRNDGYAARFGDRLMVVSLEQKSDGKLWMHASVSRADHSIPNYEDLMLLKELAFGDQRTAVQIFPPAHRHIDIAGKLPHPVQVLHLWGQYYDNEWLPDMADGGDSI